MIKPEDIGKGNRLKFERDLATYYSRNVDSSKKFVYVTKGNTDSPILKKAISKIVKIDNRVVKEDIVLRMQKLAGIIKQ